MGKKKAAPKKRKRGAGTKDAGDVSAKGLQRVLQHAQEETRQQLSQAIEKQKKTGLRLMDILRQDVDKDMFSNIWSFLQGPAEGQAGKGKAKGKKVKDVLLDGGWISRDEWEEAQQSGEAYDPQLGRVLVERGHITEGQLQDALAQQERSGQSFWRILVNRGLVSPKQIGDARTYGSRGPSTALADEAVTQLLLRTGLVTKKQCRGALEERERTGRDMFQILLERKVAPKAQLGRAVAAELGVPYLGIKRNKPQQEAVNLLPEHLARQNRMIPATVDDDTVQLAMANPHDVAAREWFRMLVNMDVEPVLAFEEDVMGAIARCYKEAAPEGKRSSAFDRLKAKLQSVTAIDEGMTEMAESAGVINVVGSIIEGAINSRATDIHLEPQANGLRVRYRIDGLLYDIMNLSESFQDAVISRVKVLSGLDITERRQPQDGHFTLENNGRDFDLRVASLPTVLGEKIVLRLLDPENVFKGLRELGLEPGQLQVMDEAIARPNGMVLVTGPIGSGKTTTLYAALSQVDILTNNVVTIEDPVEYQLPGINQIQASHRAGWTFAGILRAVIRQDADVMMVGEIRDEDTASVAVRAALTGHLVFSTLHTRDAVGAIITLGHLGVPAYMIPDSVAAVVAQRLVRRMCHACRQKYKPAKSVLAAAGLTAQAARRITFYKADGCEECFQMGYRGRTGIFEILQMTTAIKELILQGADREEVHAQATDEGMTTLMEAGLAKVRAGITTIEEVLRVTSA